MSNGGSPTSWMQQLTKALMVLVITAVVLGFIEKVFVNALPGLLVILALVGIIRFAVSAHRNRDGW